MTEHVPQGENMSEEVLRLLFVPRKIHPDSTVSPPVVYELVGINGVERIRRYYITSMRTEMSFDRLGCFRKRPDTVRRWNRLTGERLASDLVPVAAGRKTT